jgi:hypothetical protein
VFRAVASLLDGEAPGRQPTFAIVARDADHPRVYAYTAPACAFARIECGDATAAYVAGIECWASDLLAVLDGELGPIALMYARARLWNAVPRVVFDVFADLYRVSHPLSRPAEVLEVYRRVSSRLSGTST